MTKKNNTRNIGVIGVVPPKNACNDVHCPFHGHLSVRGRTFEGKVVSVKASKTAIIFWERKIFVPKYERFEKRKSKVRVHVPACMDIKQDDLVLIGECRPISKTKKFVIIKKENNGETS